MNDFKNVRSSHFFTDMGTLQSSDATLLDLKLNISSFDSSFSRVIFFETNVLNISKKLNKIADDFEIFDENDNFSSPYFYDSYFYFKNSSYISFFLNNMVDVPVCFKKSHSLRRASFELPTLKLFNLITRQGKKEKSLRNLLKNYFSNTNSLMLFESEINANDHFYKNYLSNLTFFFRVNSPIFINPITTENFGFIDPYKDIFKSFFLTNLDKISPVFAYFIYSVDKNVRKYSRGKSGKYVFIWKYIAPYKRQYLALRWLTKELKFRFEKKFHQRFNSIINNLHNDLSTTFAWKSKVFSHNYVFKNFKKSLMINLKTIVK